MKAVAEVVLPVGIGSRQIMVIIHRSGQEGCSRPVKNPDRFLGR
jgi:hypothetical protein